MRRKGEEERCRRIVGGVIEDILREVHEDIRKR